MEELVDDRATAQNRCLRVQLTARRRYTTPGVGLVASDEVVVLWKIVIGVSGGPAEVESRSIENVAVDAIAELGR